MFFVVSEVIAMSTLDLGGAQMGDFKPRDIAGLITNINLYTDELFKLLKIDLDVLDARVTQLEKTDEAHSDERQALTQIVMALGVDSTSVREVHNLLKKQIDHEQTDRNQRRRHLDIVLLLVLAFSAAGMLLDLLRVFRRSRTAKPHIAA